MFGVSRLPYLSRPNFVRELRQIIPWSILAGLVEGQFASIVVAKSFHGSDTLIALATATPMGAHILSLIWGMLCVGRRKLRLATFFSAGTVLLAGLVAAIPNTPAGGLWYIAQMFAAQIMLAGMVTVRTALWRANYPDVARGRITAKLQGIRFVVSVIAVQSAAWICDLHPWSYRLTYPAAAIVGAVAVWMLTHMRVRGERAALRRHQRADTQTTSGDGATAISLMQALSPWIIFGRAIQVLRDDRRFLLYCIAQTLLGVGNLLTFAIVTATITRVLIGDSGRGFWISTALIVALPRLVMLASLGRWGNLLDRVGVVQLRVLNVGCWLMSVALAMVAVLVAHAWDGSAPGLFILAVGLFTVRGLFEGLGRGGGALAWNIGHLHFAKSDNAEVYMGIHVFLFGVRGALAPLLGMLLWQSIGWPVWPIALILILISVGIYISMARAERREA